MDDDQFIRAVRKAEAAYDEVEQDFSELGNLRRVYCADKLADAFYYMARQLKTLGRDEAANAAHRKANEFWSSAQEQISDLTKKDK
jgi:hypothetical protein